MISIYPICVSVKHREVEIENNGKLFWKVIVETFLNLIKYIIMKATRKRKCKNTVVIFTAIEIIKTMVNRKFWKW